MSNLGPSEQIPQAILLNSPWEEAAALLEQAARVGKETPELTYLLALCYKRDGKVGEARAALRKITPPDANVLLQLGLLSFTEKQYAQAAEEFGRALDLDGNSYAACYNLLLCRLHLGQVTESLELLPRAESLAPSDEERRFLALLEQMLRQQAPPPGTTLRTETGPGANGAASPQVTLATMTAEEERRLVNLLQGIDQPDVLYPLLQTLVAWRPESSHIQRTYLELALVQAKRLADRYQWSDAEEVLASVGRLAESPALSGDPEGAPLRVALLNFQGVCACMLQDFERGGRFFASALKLAGNKTWLNQNLALTCEMMGLADQAELYWNRYFDLLDARTPAPPIPNYRESLAFAGLHRLGEMYTKLERHNSAISFLQRAHRLRPRDTETLDKLFHLYVQSRRPEEARRVLRQLRDIRPTDPQYELFELELIEVRSIEDLDRILAEVKRIISKHPGDMRVEERALHTVANCIPMMSRKAEQLSEQLANIVGQVRRLPNYQINWPVVHDEMRYLKLEFQKLRKLCNKCLGAVTSEDHRRTVRDLIAYTENKIDICVSMGG